VSRFAYGATTQREDGIVLVDDKNVSAAAIAPLPVPTAAHPFEHPKLEYFPGQGFTPFEH